MYLNEHFWMIMQHSAKDRNACLLEVLGYHAEWQESQEAKQAFT